MGCRHSVKTWVVLWTCDCSLDDDIESENLPVDELELYFHKLVPPVMQRGRVEGQEIPVTVILFSFQTLDALSTCSLTLAFISVPLENSYI